MYLLSKYSIYEKIICTVHISTSITKLVTRSLLLHKIAYVHYLPSFALCLSVKVMVALLFSIYTYRNSYGRLLISKKHIDVSH